MHTTLPTITDLVCALRAVQRDIPSNEDGAFDVRLRVVHDDWQLLWGDPSFDLDHRGDWGASTISRCDPADALQSIAIDLLDQVQQSMADELDDTEEGRG